MEIKITSGARPLQVQRASYESTNPVENNASYTAAPATQPKSDYNYNNNSTHGVPNSSASNITTHMQSNSTPVRLDASTSNTAAIPNSSNYNILIPTNSTNYNAQAKTNPSNVNVPAATSPSNYNVPTTINPSNSNIPTTTNTSNYNVRTTTNAPNYNVPTTTNAPNYNIPTTTNAHNYNIPTSTRRARNKIQLMSNPDRDYEYYEEEIDSRANVMIERVLTPAEVVRGANFQRVGVFALLVLAITLFCIMTEDNISLPYILMLVALSALAFFRALNL